MKYIRPCEWNKNKVICFAYIYRKDLWGENLIPAQYEFISLINELIDEDILVLVPNEKEKENFINKLGKSVATLVMPYDDVWLRDTMPISILDEEGRNISLIPHFNGWGNKYLFKDDKTLSKRFARYISYPVLYTPLVFEGGAIEVNGSGTLLTTESCLLNKNRNPGLKKKEIEHELFRIFGSNRIIWLKEGLLNDHTDGHIDNLARFIDDNKIAIMTPHSVLDPNYNVLKNIKKDLEKENFEIIELPSVGNVDGLSASYLNFLILKNKVIMPGFGSKYDEEALKILTKNFDLPVKMLSAKAILTGGGTFHCISQEVFGLRL